MFKLPQFLKFSSRQAGFTLLELLVVVSIIGILIAISSTAFSTAQKKSRDAKRRADIRSMQNAFEQYYAQSDGLYAAPCASMTSLADGTVIIQGGWPADPKPGQVYTCAPASTTSYCVCAHLELGGGNATTTDCTTLGAALSSNSYYCLKNLQ